MKNIIFYFTGTGNSMDVSKQVAGKLKETQLIRIREGMILDYSMEKVERMGFVYPVYFGAIPNLMNDFLDKVKLPESSYTFLVATCGGMAVGANDLLRRKLSKKGIKVEAGYTVTMPSNNQTSYPPIEASKLPALITDSNAKIKEIAEAVTKKEKKVISRTITSYIAPPVARYRFPKHSDKDFEVEASCIGCELCMKVCPAKNIRMINKKPSWTHNCARCTACMQICPKGAIQFGASRNWGRYINPNIKIDELQVK